MTRQPIPIEPERCGGKYVTGRVLGICSGCDLRDPALMGKKGAPATVKDGAWHCDSRTFNGVREVVEVSSSEV